MADMKYYKTIIVSGQANKETLQYALQSTDVEKVHVDGIYVTDVTSTPQNNAMIRVYVARERIADFDYRQFLQDINVASRTLPFYIELNIDLPVGEELDVGHLSQDTASDISFTIKYTVTKA